MRRPFIAGNWKMNKTVEESRKLVEELLPLVEDIQDVDIAVCPPATSLYPVADVIQGSNVKLGAQNMHWEENGAYTGDISPVMVKEAGCEYIIIGHSERRKFYGETDEDVNKKVHAAFSHGLKPIICVGESLKQREAGETQKVVRDQVTGALKGLKELNSEDLKEIVIAYEPIWAIGTGKSASPETAQEVISFIRELLREELGAEIAEAIRIQYGGSVKPHNIKGFMEQKDIDGALVGGASLKADSFSEIVKGF